MPIDINRDWGKITSDDWSNFTDKDIDFMLEKMNKDKFKQILKSLELDKKNLEFAIVNLDGIAITKISPDKISPDKLRIYIYLNCLMQAKSYFANLGRKIDDEESSICILNNALRSNNLIYELAKKLDNYLERIVYFDEIDFFKDKNKRPRSQDLISYNNKYFEDRFFNNFDNSEGYKKGRNEFLNKYYVTRDALNILTSEFKDSIYEVCKRTKENIIDIQKLFKDSIKELIQIENTGSDPHRGGRQVLILHFKTSKSPKFKLIYKPRDVEIDCLLAGNSSAINEIKPGFMEKSLIEMINEKISEKYTELPLLRTILILPVNCTSKSKMDLNTHLPIEEAYGYEEFLENQNVLIGNQDERERSISNFYLLAGLWTSAACIFSISDLHHENIIINEYKPTFIDLEVSFINVIHDVDKTLLYGPSGGITFGGGKNSIDSFNKLDSYNIDKEGNIEIGEKGEKKRIENRLKENEGPDKIIPVNWTALIDGFNKGMYILQEIIRYIYTYTEWMKRFENVLVRYTPFATGDFYSLLLFLYKDYYYFTEDITFNKKLNSLLILKSKEYQDEKDLPKYLFFKDDIVGIDLKSLDIPVFYNRIGISKVIDSRGNLIRTGKKDDDYFDLPPKQLIEGGSIIPMINGQEFLQLKTEIYNTLERQKKVAKL